MKIIRLSCMAAECNARHFYAVPSVQVLLYTSGVCAVKFHCKTCLEQSEFPVPDQVAISLDQAGAPSTIVHVPEEVLEWPMADVPAISAHDVAVMERSSQRHLEECIRRELLDVHPDNARSEG